MAQAVGFRAVWSLLCEAAQTRIVAVHNGLLDLLSAGAPRGVASCSRGALGSRGTGREWDCMQQWVFWECFASVLVTAAIDGGT